MMVSPRNLMVLAAVGMTGCMSFPNLGQQPIDGVPGVAHFGTLTPATVASYEDAQNRAVFGEVGPTGTSFAGGFTFDFVGTGEQVCIWVDPEIVTWNSYLGAIGDLVPAEDGAPGSAFAYPDNIGDDGDIDLRVGQSVFYTGTVGTDLEEASARIGNFLVDITDSLGNTIPSDLDLCSGTAALGGRGVPELCTIDTIEGVSYTAAMQAFSVPLDDFRLSYGFLFVEGGCDELAALYSEFAGNKFYTKECVLQGEGLIPGSESGAAAAQAGFPTPSWIGGEAPVIPGSRDFESNFCDDNIDLQTFCVTEAADVEARGLRCAWGEPANEDEGTTRCFCGDPSTLPRLAD